MLNATSLMQSLRDCNSTTFAALPLTFNLKIYVKYKHLLIVFRNNTIPLNYDQNFS